MLGMHPAGALHPRLHSVEALQQQRHRVGGAEAGVDWLQRGLGAGAAQGAAWVRTLSPLVDNIRQEHAASAAAP